MYLALSKLRVDTYSSCSLIAISRQAQAFPKADRHYLPPRPQAIAPCPRPCPRHAHFDDAALLANNKGRRQRQTTPRRNKSLARAEMGSSAKTKTTARTSKRKARPEWGVGEKGECLRWLNTWIGELICRQSKQSRGGSESPRRPGVPVHTATAAFLGKTRVTKTDDSSW